MTKNERILQNFDYSQITNPFLKLYGFEKSYHYFKELPVLERNWTWIIYLSAFYALLVHYGQRWMADKKPYSFRKVLVYWNFTLALFSVVECLRMGPEPIWQWSQTGFTDTLCHFRAPKALGQFWGVIFTFSKLLEWGDTIFLVLSKKPVIFLHWYHHATVAIYGFYMLDFNDPAIRWFILINSFVHAVMYSYYGLKAMRIRIPTKVSICITSLQIAQMVFGVSVSLITLWWKVSGVPCERSYPNIYAAGGMYVSYLVLFANFFYQTYLGKRRPKRKMSLLDALKTD